jgi:hypothetical protein
MVRFPRAVQQFFAATMLAAILFGLPTAANAADKVKVGVFPVSSSLPYFIARDLAISATSISSRR